MINELLKLIIKPENKILDSASKQISGKLGFTPAIKKDKWAYWHVGDDRPTLVAHLDTKNKATEAPLLSEIVVTTKFDLYGTPNSTLSLNSNRLTCLGGDDRAGVYVIIEVLKGLNKSQMPNVILTYGEEIGLIGAYDFCNDILNKDFKSSFMVQLDRRGDDVVFYGCENKLFQDVLSKALNKTKGWGSSSDIRAFQNKYKINSANVSVGFNNEHTKQETVDFGIVNKTIKSLTKIFKNEEIVNLLGSQKWVDPAPVSTGWEGYYPNTTSTIVPKTYTKKPSTTVKPKVKVTKKLPTFDEAATDMLLNDWSVITMAEAPKTIGKWVAIDFTILSPSQENIGDIEINIYVDKASKTKKMALLLDGEELKLKDLESEITKEQYKVLQDMIPVTFKALGTDAFEKDTKWDIN